VSSLNDSFISNEQIVDRAGARKLRDNEREAEQGLLMKTRITLTPGLPLYRFASSDNPDGWFTSPWWIGYSPFEALKEYARVENMPLGLAARECLAILPKWSRCDQLVRASVRQPLVAWVGTPKTQRVKDKVTQRYGDRWEPDRRVTQLYIPGLSQKSEGSTQQIWQVALIVAGPEPIASATERVRKF
jgi:hypothetical protein